ncbi:tyrosine-protein phosphatase [Lacticaseibacillus jixianensis]|uniref:Tyrosine-protein phosphatase n=1 Tax=Lacticaseibacillus jixianensis TaxID=2486012 RepID=A0ABW4B673_9LACO|nr:tyrosine-protein phosphatase [Lacticaseibacillus jixianensis]
MRRRSFITESNGHLIALTGTINLRDMGGYHTKDGRTIRRHRLYRSGLITFMPRAVQAHMLEVGLNQDLDLRQADNSTTAPDVKLPGVAYHNLSLYPFADHPHFQEEFRGATTAEKFKLARLSYLYMATDPRTAKMLRRVIQLLVADETGATLFHCFAGKDRTGVVAMLIEGLLGVPEKVAHQDYIVTNDILMDRFKGNQAAADLPMADRMVTGMNSQPADDSYFAAVQTVVKKYGGWGQYAMRHLALSVSEIADLRRLYLE